MHFSFSSVWVNRGEPRGDGTVLVFIFFLLGEGSCLVLETTSLDDEDIPTGFVRVLVNALSLYASTPNFFLTILLHCCGIDITWVFILPHREGPFVINFTLFT